MKKILFFLTIFVCLIDATAQTVRQTKDTPTAAYAAAKPTSLPIRRVILYSNGVAYIERRVAGGETFGPDR